MNETVQLYAVSESVRDRPIIVETDHKSVIIDKQDGRIGF